MQNLLTNDAVSNKSGSLNDLYANYKKGLLKKDDFEASVLNTVRSDIHRFGMSGWSKYDYDDYISSIYDHISRAIGVYQEVGSSFETYISAIVRLTAKEYRSRQIRNYVEETAAWITQLPDLYACESEEVYNEQINEYLGEETKKPVQLHNPRQLLILILKCCTHVTRDFLEKISPSVGIAPEALCAMVDQLKEQRQKYELDILKLRERINRQFYRCILFEKNLKELSRDSIATQRTKRRLEQERGRLVNTRNRLARKRLDPSNTQIAQILGLSKGTVDTVLYKLKKQSMVK